MKKWIRKKSFNLFSKFIPELNKLSEVSFETIKNVSFNSNIGQNSKLFPPYQVVNTTINDYSYISKNSLIFDAEIGKFCSIGSNFTAGLGLHPINGISTAPMFYSSTNLSNGVTLCENTKFQEKKPIKIGNDVFIGVNVTVLDGISIGNGAVIGAGAVVTKDIPPYAVAVGNPIRILKYRFSEEIIKELNQMEWWNWKDEDLKKVEENFYDIELFIQKYSNDLTN